VTLDSRELIGRLVAEGMGASILARLGVALASDRSALRVTELDLDAIRFTWHLLHNQDLSPWIADCIQEEAANWPLAETGDPASA